MHKCNVKWLMIPELFFYEQGEPPKSYTYEITVDESNAFFKLSWVQLDDQSTTIEFGGKHDSISRSVEVPEGAAASYTVVIRSVLESRLFIGGTETACARRVVSASGDLMSVLQVNKVSSGDQVRITQVFKRA